MPLLKQLSTRMDCPSIESAEYDVFCKKFKDGQFVAQRFGQAFYNHFNLHKLTDQHWLNDLYNVEPEETARSMIRNLFSFH